MITLKQFPAPGDRVRRNVGDVITISLELNRPADGEAFLRTNIGHADIHRAEIIDSVDNWRPYLARDWHDIPMRRARDAEGRELPARYEIRMPLIEAGSFSAKACFLPSGESTPLWPAGDDLCVKVGSARNIAANSIYTAFPRQFGPNSTLAQSPADSHAVSALDRAGYSVIPAGGTFRDLAANLDTIFGMGFRIIQLLPIYPVPTTFARMGRFGSPFAATDFRSVDPSLAEFDKSATQMDQFRELLRAVHARGGRLFLDLPANHAGWASVLLNHHPEWFKRRNGNGEFVSPGAWGVTWEDLVELDHSRKGVREFLAEVFLFWLNEGVDGFRCDAGYMIPGDVWRYIVARVRTRFHDAVFMLEGLGGKISVTDSLLHDANLDWAYSEVFQTEDRSDLERYLPGALALSDQVGPLVNFAETHDNLRLAARSNTYSAMRVALSALTSQDGAFGITNGVEWFATERVDVHGASALNWGAEENQLDWIRRINALLASHGAFAAGARTRMIQRDDGNSIAFLREPANGGQKVLALVNLDASSPQAVCFNNSEFDPDGAADLLGSRDLPAFPNENGVRRCILPPGKALCLSRDRAALDAVESAMKLAAGEMPEALRRQKLRDVALRIRARMRPDAPALDDGEDVDSMAAALARDPIGFIEGFCRKGAMPPVSIWQCPQDASRIAPVPSGNFILVASATPFRVRIECAATGVIQQEDSVGISDGRHIAVFMPFETEAPSTRLRFAIELFEGGKDARVLETDGLLLNASRPIMAKTHLTDREVLSGEHVALLTNGCGAMCRARAKWGTIRSRYDALLASNPDGNVPCDRLVLWTRCRMWVRRRAYSQAVNAACLCDFFCEAGSSEAAWKFKVPVGLGRWISLSIRLSMEHGRNVLAMQVCRNEADAGADDYALPDDEPVTVIFRPDVECRSFHEVTKAYAGPEHEYPRATHAFGGGFDFSPYGGLGLRIESPAAQFIQEPEWHYMQGLPDDADRGLGGETDLFSPGYFTVDLNGGDACGMIASSPAGASHVKRRKDLARPIAEGSPDDMEMSKALTCALCDFIVKRDELSTVIAGYPWFLDWGRDTFIVLRGMIAAGMTETSLSILREFGRFERSGTLPNMIRGNDDSNRDTSDAALWYIVAARELCDAFGSEDTLSADCGGRPLSAVLRSLMAGYRDGTPNGIRMDPESGLVYSPSHYTWMDTNFPAGTPREGYPVEIQALWISALKFADRVFPGEGWGGIADAARKSLLKHFWIESEGYLSDCLHCSAGTPASRAAADDHLRSNQLFAITLGAMSGASHCKRILRACETLVVPGAIRSLADRPTSYHLPIWRDGTPLNDPARPYWGEYRGDEDTRRKPAYHNGTAWTWPFPSYVEAMLMTYGDSVVPTARALLSSGIQLMNDGALGHLPEIVDGNAPHTQRGCDAQAWGASEFLRVKLMLDTTRRRSRRR